jgi:hypothetical protein
MSSRTSGRYLTPVLGTMAIVFLGCMSKPVPVPSPVTPQFSYQPSNSEAGTGTSIALIEPELSNARKGQWEPAAGTAMRAAIGRSLVSYFTANAFTISGPFESVEIMTFPEKKQANLLLTIEHDLAPTFPQAQSQHSAWDGAVKKVYSEGVCTLSGTISFVMWEPLSMQRMWAKQVEIPATRVDCTAEGPTQAHWGRAIENKLASLYSKAFSATMSTAEKYFHPEEVALVKSQAEELRERKVY